MTSKTHVYDLTPMHEIGMDFTLNLWTANTRDIEKSILGCQNWSIVLAMDQFWRERLTDSQSD